MGSKRLRILQFLDAANIFDFTARHLAIIGKDKLPILAYHRVAQHSPDFQFDGEVISATPEEFEKQICWIAKHFDVISFDELHRGYVIKRPLIITFDDGYKDNYDNAFPILKKYGVPATIFLSTGYIGTNRLFWWDELALLIKRTSKTEIVINIPSPTVFHLNAPEDKIAAIKVILKYLKSISSDSMLSFITHLREELGTDILNNQTERLALNWDEVREMSVNGIEFGSHGIEHFILANCSSSVVREEIEASRRKIENEINKKVIVFSYPVGGPNSYNSTTKKILSETGYSFAANYIHGINQLSSIRNFELKRIHIEKENSMPEIKFSILFQQ